MSFEPEAPRDAFRSKRGRLIAGAASGIGHVGLLLALMLVQPRAPATPPAPPPPIEVTLVQAPTPPPPPSPPPAPTPPTPEPVAAAPAPAPAAAPPRRRLVVRSAPTALPSPVPQSAAGHGWVGLSAAALAGAAGADDGAQGGECDMARRLERALREDARVRAALTGAEGQAIMVWNGEWVRDQEQDGKGLATVREAIIWTVGFAPAACRDQPMRGLVLLSLSDGSGGARLAVGGGFWRWSDLLR